MKKRTQMPPLKRTPLRQFRSGLLRFLLVFLTLHGVAVHAAPDPSVDGQWEVLTANGQEVQWPEVPIHMAVLPTGLVLFWAGGDDAPGRDTTQTYLWDPKNPTAPPVLVPNARSDIFCAGHAFLWNGRLLVSGGHVRDGVGLKDANSYDPFSRTWSKVRPMNAGRWYPTVTSLGNREALVISGNTRSGVPNTLPQVYQTDGTWRSLITAQRALALYPRVQLAVFGGKAGVLQTDPEPTQFLDPSGTGTWTAVAPTVFGGARDEGSSVMYDDNKVLIMGGGGADPSTLPSKTAEMIDLNISPPTWSSAGDMNFRRRYLNATRLSDGKVLVTGGTSSSGFNDATEAVRAAEIWDPETGHWSGPLASMKYKRVYHSTAVLLPDGRVLAGGGGRPAPAGEPNRYDVEFYSPPYLFKSDGSPAMQPRIMSVSPSSVGYGQQFSVTTPDAAGITEVTLVRLSAVTHAFNQNQRINRLSFTQETGALRVIAPSNPNFAPPGHYMLFILDSLGVPAVATIMQLR